MENVPLDQVGLTQTEGTSGAQQPSLYERDFYQWVQQTAAVLKARAFQRVDWENVIEEIESMGRSERRDLKSRLVVLLEHLLKLDYWVSERPNSGRGWRNIIVEQRRQIQLLLEDSPSLRPRLEDGYSDALPPSPRRCDAQSSAFGIRHSPGSALHSGGCPTL